MKDLAKLFDGKKSYLSAAIVALIGLNSLLPVILPALVREAPLSAKMVEGLLWVAGALGIAGAAGKADKARKAAQEVAEAWVAIRDLAGDIQATDQGSPDLGK